MYLVSVIVPIYNVKEYLATCISSIKSQSFKNLEIILVDDGSTDGSGALCDELAADDTRIRVIHQPNAGLSAARNAGTAACHGDYITYVDSDDRIEPDYIKLLYDIIQKENADVAVCGYHSFFQDNDKYDLACSSKVDVISGRDAVLDIIQYHKRFMIMASGKLYSRKLIEFLHYPEGKLHEDEFVTYKVFYQCDKVGVSNLKYYAYRIRKGSIMQSSYSIKRVEDALEGLKSAADFFDAENEKDLADHARLRYLLNLEIAWYHIHKGMENGAVKDSIKADLVVRHRKLYSEEGKRLITLCTFTERMTILIFRVTPRLYCLFSTLYLKINNDLIVR